MPLPENFTLFLIAPPEQAHIAAQYGLVAAQMAYRVGNGPHLFRTRGTMTRSGGLLVADHVGFDGRGEAEPFCQEVIRECAARGSRGAFFDFEGRPLAVLRRAVELLSPLFRKKGWSLYVPEGYAGCSPTAKVVIPTALSGGSLKQRLSQAVEDYGAERVVLGLEWSAEDFTLPAPTGSGTRLSRDELDELMVKRAPSVYFDQELCAHYFTYMNTGQSAHFVLYDNASSMAKKLRIAAALGIGEGFLPLPERIEELEKFLAR